MKKSKNPVGKDFYSLTVTADYFLNRRFKNSLAGEKFAFSGFRLVLSTGVSTEGSSEQSQGVSEASPHWTEASLVSITAPKAIGIWMQRLWVTVNVQEVLLPGHCGPVWMTGSPQQIVLVVPGCANGETVTGTQTVSFW